jgi:hypothetical protein
LGDLWTHPAIPRGIIRHRQAPGWASTIVRELAGYNALESGNRAIAGNKATHRGNFSSGLRRHLCSKSPASLRLLSPGILSERYLSCFEYLANIGWVKFCLLHAILALNLFCQCPDCSQLGVLPVLGSVCPERSRVSVFKFFTRKCVSTTIIPI